MWTTQHVQRPCPESSGTPEDTPLVPGGTRHQSEAWEPGQGVELLRSETSPLSLHVARQKYKSNIKMSAKVEMLSDTVHSILAPELVSYMRGGWGTLGGRCASSGGDSVVFGVSAGLA